MTDKMGAGLPCPPSRAWRICLILAVLAVFAMAVAIRLDDITDLPLDFHPTRQLWSALIARGMYFQDLPGIPDWQRKMSQVQWQSEEILEPRIMETLAVASYRVLGAEELWAPRLFSALFWVLGGIPLFFLAKSLTSKYGAFVAVAFYLYLPYAVVSSRAFMPDPLMVALMCAALWAVYEWQTKWRWPWAVLAGLLLGAAIFTKIVAFFPLLGGVAALLLAGQSLKRLVKNIQVWAVALLAALPSVVYLIYGYIATGSWARESGGRFMPGLLASPFFYLRWENKIAYMTGSLGGISAGHIILVLALVGLLLYTNKANRLFLVGLWAGYIVFGIAFNYQISTHDYYSMPLIPVLALSLAPFGEAIFKRLEDISAQKPYIPFAAFGLCLAGLALTLWDVHVSFKSVDYRPEAAVYAAIGQKLGHNARLTALTEDYGYRLAYWGFLNPLVWPSYGDLNYMNKVSGANQEFNQAFATYTAGKQYFAVTWFDELTLQPQLRERLSQYPVFDQGDGYIIYDLRRK